VRSGIDPMAEAQLLVRQRLDRMLGCSLDQYWADWPAFDGTLSEYDEAPQIACHKLESKLLVRQHS
jgi:hypothetical protein